MELIKYLVLRSPNLGNIGTVKERPEGFVNPDYYQISNEELEAFSAMSNAHKKAFIQEKLSEKENQIIAAMPEKKNVEVAEVETKLVEASEIEIVEPFAEATIETVTIENELDEIESSEQFETVTEKPKAKGRPKKVN
jgi:hypothetical protein